MEAMEDGVELHIPPTRLPPPLRDTSVSGKDLCLCCFCHVFFFTTHMILILDMPFGNIKVHIKEEVCDLEIFLFCPHSLPMAAPDREQLKFELQQVNKQITQQTQMEVSILI